MLVVTKDVVQEFLISPNKDGSLKGGPTKPIYDTTGKVVGVIGGDVYEGQFDFIPFDKKSPNFTMLPRCNSGHHKIFIEAVSEMKNSIAKDCNKNITKEDKKLCTFFEKNKSFDWNNVKEFWKLFARQWQNSMGPVKFEINENSSKISGKMNIGPKLLNIYNLKKTKYGFLNASTQSGLSILLNASAQSSLSLYGGFGSINFKGTCSN